MDYADVAHGNDAPDYPVYAVPQQKCNKQPLALKPKASGTSKGKGKGKAKQAAGTVDYADMGSEENSTNTSNASTGEDHYVRHTTCTVQ